MYPIDAPHNVGGKVNRGYAVPRRIDVLTHLIYKYWDERMLGWLMPRTVDTDWTIPEGSGTRVDLIYSETLEFKKKGGQDERLSSSPFLDVMDDGQKLDSAVSGFGGPLFFRRAIQSGHLDVAISDRKKDHLL